ncbi:odorant receptor 131-2-like, partial [Plectropomus leopardus]
FLLEACRFSLTYPVCGVLTMLASLANEISPLTLMVMSLERYVAVCYPLRHSTIISNRNTAVSIIVLWAFSSLNILTQVLLLVEFPFENLERLQMKMFGAKKHMRLGPMSDEYDKGYTYFMFVPASVAVASSYIGVMIAARSASTDKALVKKARNTLLLQLGLSLSSTITNPVLRAMSQVLDKITEVHIHIVVYVFIVMFPRCLSALIYGIRDQTIRPILMFHLWCRQKLSVVLAEPEVSH